MPEAVPFKKVHLTGAARLVASRYARCRVQEPRLPSEWESAEAIGWRLERWSRIATGVAIGQNGRVDGFMLGIVSPYEGVPAAWVPDLGHGSVDTGPGGIYHLLYKACARAWVDRLCPLHHVTVMDGDTETRAIFDALGFGTFAVDALRGLDMLPSAREDLTIRKADAHADLDAILGLQRSLIRHLRGSPIFLGIDGEADVDRRAAWLARPSNTMWMACSGDRLLAAIGCGPPAHPQVLASAGSSTLAISFACTSEDARRTGIGSAILRCIIEQARADGHERCYVAFESANREAMTFWLNQGFRTVSRTMRRRVDPRVLAGTAA